MAAEIDEYPVGSVAVKDLYEGGSTDKGWAVAIKTMLVSAAAYRGTKQDSS